MSGEKYQGTVKWFSNKKGYGFISPGEGSPTMEDIFVHQSSIYSEGYRTLDEGWAVEFTLGRDEDGKVKAENVTAPGGGPCTGPRSERRHRSFGRQKKHDEGGHSGDDEENGGAKTSGDEEGDNGKGGGGRRGGGGGRGRRRRDSRGRGGGGGGGGTRQPAWHDVLTDDVKSDLKAKNVRLTTGTVDVSVGEARIKLGTRGYCSMAHADAILAEGTFTCDADGHAELEWKRIIHFDKTAGEWKKVVDRPPEVLTSINLSSDEVGAVGSDETATTLWGDAPTDPKNALEENEFEMRRVVLTPKYPRR